MIHGPGRVQDLIENQCQEIDPGLGKNPENDQYHEIDLIKVQKIAQN